MFIIDKEKAKEILVAELDYKPSEAQVFLIDYPPIHDELADSVRQWFENRTVSDFNVYGLTLIEVMKTRRRNFLLAIRELNLLLNPDLTDDDRNRLLRLLRKPPKIL
jgi:hypothetical protein